MISALAALNIDCVRRFCSAAFDEICRKYLLRPVRLLLERIKEFMLTQFYFELCGSAAILLATKLIRPLESCIGGFLAKFLRFLMERISIFSMGNALKFGAVTLGLRTLLGMLAPADLEANLRPI
jgi:hypothetical protein